MHLIFDTFKLADELFKTTLRSLENCVLVNDNLCKKLYSSLELPVPFDKRFKVASIPFLIPDLNLPNWLYKTILRLIHLFQVS